MEELRFGFMKFLRQMILGAGVAALLAHPPGLRADTTNAAPDFKEVYDLIHAHLEGVTDGGPGSRRRAGIARYQLHAQGSG